MNMDQNREGQEDLPWREAEISRAERVGGGRMRDKRLKNREDEKMSACMKSWAVHVKDVC